MGVGNISVFLAGLTAGVLLDVRFGIRSLKLIQTFNKILGSALGALLHGLGPLNHLPFGLFVLLDILLGLLVPPLGPLWEPGLPLLVALVAVAADGRVGLLAVVALPGVAAPGSHLGVIVAETEVGLKLRIR